MRFTKVHGNGNDFIVIDNRESRYGTEELSRLARLLCRRKFSLGADGMLVVEEAATKKTEKTRNPREEEPADFAMRIFNADGSEGEMCGNGARALARYAFEKNLAPSAGGAFCFTTLAGRVRALVVPPYAELDMGELDLTPEKNVFGDRLQSHGMEFLFSFLKVGVPHCVLFVEDYHALDDSLKFEIGRQVSHDFARFPEGSNVSFAQAISEEEALAVTYERGVEDLTASCGTGCVAVAAALFLRGLAQGLGNPDGALRAHTLRAYNLRVHNPGGINEVRLSFAPDLFSCHAWLKGKTAMVAEGRILDDALLEGALS